MGTYEAITGVKGDDDASALDLYIWNAQISGALLAPLHICEVVIRNAIADALAWRYGANWPWSSAFETSLPSPPVGYNARRDLFDARQKAPAVGQTGKVIAELKFVFWQRLFTSRHDQRLWSPRLTAILPGLDSTKNHQQLRQELYNDLDVLRILRNRIAHHEPILSRNLQDDFSRITRVIRYRSDETANWMLHHQQVTHLLHERPTP
ncbi:hypothetical protein AB6N01_16040 [Alcaligenes nematophilus]|uniref:hypothetical protein n=1 Tax=Alcaligenes nematophilus TaxID=2994643 RepID=UPI0034E0B6AD